MKITIKGDPVPKKRHRTFLRGSRVTSYDPQHEIKEFVRIQMQHYARLEKEDYRIDEKTPNLPFKHPLSVEMTFYLPIPESSSKRTKNALSWNLENHTKKPDLDNLAKFYLDCGNDILWQDDRQIFNLVLKKCYSLEPKTEIEIMPIQEDEIFEESKKILEIIGIDDSLTIARISDSLNSLLDHSHYHDKVAVLLYMISGYWKELKTINDQYPSYLQNIEQFLIKKRQKNEDS